MRAAHHQQDQLLLLLREGEVVLDDWLDGLRQRPDAISLGDGERGGHFDQAWFAMDPRTLLDKEGAVRPDKLLGFYVRSLALSATGSPALGCVVARDTVLWALPMAQADAQARLQQLMQLWLQGQSAPLPLPLRTAMAVAAGDLQAAEQAYAGSHVLDGECQDPSWARCYPGWDELLASGALETLARDTYGPLLDWSSTCLWVDGFTHGVPAGEPSA